MEDPGSSILQVVMLITLLGLSALFSGSETALFGISQVNLRKLSDGGSKKAALVRQLLRKPEGLLASLLVGNTAVNVAFTSLMAVLTLNLWRTTVNKEIISLIGTIMTTALLLLFGEVTPKAIAAHNPESFAFSVLRIVQAFTWLLRPIVWVLNGISSAFLTLFGDKGQGSQTPSVTEEIIKTAVTIGAEEGTVDSEEKAMIYGIFKSSDTPVGKIMVPRAKMLWVDEYTTLSNVVKLIYEEGYSRIPVLSSSNRKVIGVIYAKDMLPFFSTNQNSFTVKKVMRRPHFCRPTKRASALLAEMRANGTHMSFVMDSTKQLIGLITLEDLLEEIVGDIIDEYDHQELAQSDLEGVASC